MKKERITKIIIIIIIMKIALLMGHFYWLNVNLIIMLSNKG